MTILVPRGAEAAAVRRARSGVPIIELPAGDTAAAALPKTIEGDVVILGLCGALRTLRVGDIAVYRSITNSEGSVQLDHDVAATLAGLAHVHVVAACSTDHVVTTMSERRALAVRFDADVVDMEGSALASAFAQRHIRCTMVRVVSDDATRDLPGLGRAITAGGGLDYARVAFGLARHPRAAIAFISDVRRALRTLTAVAATVARR